VVKNKQQLGMLQLKTGYKTGTAAAAAASKQASKQQLLQHCTSDQHH
jgi:cobalamin biosynthesis protein CbiD